MAVFVMITVRNALRLRKVLLRIPFIGAKRKKKNRVGDLMILQM